MENIQVFVYLVHYLCNRMLHVLHCDVRDPDCTLEHEQNNIFDHPKMENEFYITPEAVQSVI